MKKLLIAGFVGMICFQSCTKENTITPQQTSPTTSPHMQQQAAAYSQVKHLAPVYDMENRIIIKCGTDVPKMFSPKTEHPGTPIYIPKYETASR